MLQSVRAGICCALLMFPAGFSSQAAGKGEAPKPLFRDPVHDGAADPALIWNRAEKKWFMFYTNRRANLGDAPGVSWVHGTRIGIAQSADGGMSWAYRGTADIRYGKSDYSHWAPDVIDDGKIYHMFLSVVPGIFNDWNAPREIVHLTSTDLLTWNFSSKLDLGSDRVIDATVIRLPAGGWRLWYKDESDKSHIRFADSPDLDQWKPAGVAIGDRPGEGAKVFRWKRRYWMITDVWDGLAVFHSADTNAWSPQAERLLRKPGLTATDRGKGQHADVIVNNGRAFIFYFVHQGGADADPKDPHWQRRSVLQVAELEFKDGLLSCDRNKPVHIGLKPPAK